MSVRRLAGDAVQPEHFAFSEANSAWAEATIRKYPEARQQSAVIPLLMRAQDQEGWVSKAAIQVIAERLRMPLIRVLEVATFYTQFQLSPVGTRAHVQVCGTTPCMLRGAEDLKAVCRSKIHPEPFHRNAEGTMSWEEVECLGACVNAPMVMIFQDTYEDLTPERLEEVLDLFEAGRGDEVQPGPQNGRHQSVPAGGLTSLTGDYDDLIREQRRETSGGAATGSSPAGASGAAATPPSEAGRPDTDAAETNPAISGPGKASSGNTDQVNEDFESDSLTEEAHRPASGSTGGTEQGPTGQAERDAAEAGQPSVDAPKAEAPTDGDLRDKGAAAQDAMVKSDKIVADDDGPQTRAAAAEADLTGRNQKGSELVEGARTDTSDTSEGPTFHDHFASEAEQPSKQKEVGQRPDNLLAEANGTPDDLKRLRGVGPVIESKLNALGVYHFRQIASWRDVELMWVDDYLSFRGRAVRENWIAQAAELQESSGQPSSGEGEES